MIRLLLVAAVAGCFAVPASGQGTEWTDAQLAEKYKGESAVVVLSDERLEITYEAGELVAKSYIDKEILLLSDAATNIHSDGVVYHGFFNRAADIEGYTLVPDGKRSKKIKATAMRTTRSEDDNVFYDDAKQTVVSFPSLVKGARTHLRYTITHKDLHFLPSFNFQSYVPVHKARFTVEAPDWVNIKAVVKGLESAKVKTEVQNSRGRRIQTWTAEQMDGVKSVDNAPNVFYYLTHLLVRITDYKFPDAHASVQMLGNTADLYRFYYPFIKDINKAEDENIGSIVATLTKGVSDPKEKARRIYAWVQQNVRYVAYENGMGGFVPREAALVCSRKFGDCKDMSSLLVAMCRKAGLQAYFTWIGTRDKPYTYEETPVPAVDNHMICTVKFGDEYIFMDGTDFTLPFGVAPSALQGKEALVGIDEKTYRVIKVPESDASRNSSRDSTHVVLTDNGLKGTVDLRYSGYIAWRLGGRLMFQNENEREEAGRNFTSRGSNKYILKSFTAKVAEDEAKDVAMHAEFELPDYAKLVDGEWYVNMNLNRTILNTDDMKDRKVPIEYDFMYTGKEIIVLDIPAGYHVSYLPPNAELVIPKLWGYKVNYTKTTKQVRLEKTFSINTLYNNPSQFADHLRLVEGLKKAFRESVVLAKD